ncbi:MAG: sensor histidine kinase [Ruminiclostridium sp.]
MNLYKKYSVILFVVYVVCIAAMWFFIISPALKTIEGQSIYTYENMIDMSANSYKEIFKQVELTSYSFLAFDELYSVLVQNNEKNLMPDYTSKLARFRMLISHFLVDPDIYSIAFYDLYDKAILQTADNQISDNNMSYLFQKARNMGGHPLWSDIYKSNNVQNPRQSFYVISLIRTINNPNTFKQVGTMRLALTEDVLFNVIKSLNTQENKLDVYLCDGQGLVMSAKNKTAIGTNLQYVKQQNLYLENNGMYYNYFSKFSYIIKKISNYDMYVVAKIDSTLLYNSYLNISSYTVYIIIILLVFVFTFTIFTSRFIIKPIRRLVSIMDEVKQGNLDIQAEVLSKDEVGMLAVSFNQMTKSLKTLMANMLNAKLKENEMKLESLRLQIHPHFLLNTLDNIRWTARKNGDSEVEYYIEILSKMMHKNLYANSSVSTIADELDAAMVYVKLQQKRFGNRLKYIAVVPEELYGYIILTFVLQPLLENSIEHGFENKIGECTIYLIIEKNNGDLVIDITDDGKGTDEQVVRSIIKGEVITSRISALKNLHDRITLLFGSKYHGGVSFYSTPGMGTRVVVTIPTNPACYQDIISL